MRRPAALSKQVCVKQLEALQECARWIIEFERDDFFNDEEPSENDIYYRSKGAGT